MTKYLLKKLKVKIIKVRFIGKFSKKISKNNTIINLFKILENEKNLKIKVFDCD